VQQCVLCDGDVALLEDGVQDWEYGVAWDSNLIQCVRCGLVSHDPPIAAEAIPGLYPDNYLAHSGASGSSGLYGRAKKLLADRGVKAVEAHIPAGGTILEVGSGNGHFLARVGERRPDVRLVGVDIDSAGDVDLANYVFHHGQLQDVVLKEASVDVLYCSNLIEHVADPIEFSQLCHRALKPGGIIYGVTPNHRSLDRRLFRRYWAGYHYPRHTFVFDHENLPKLLRIVGFCDVTTRGSYSFWYTSLANRFITLPGTKRRGVAFAVVTVIFLPLDLLLNLFTTHGSMSFTARRPA